MLCCTVRKKLRTRIKKNMLRQSAKENFFTVEINIPHHGWGMLDTYTLLKQLFFDLNDINTQEAAKLFLDLNLFTTH